jgi:XRE family transcriptional regulator, regulator of sulfur utilization
VNYAKALRVARAMADLQQKELAKLAGMDPSHISLIEMGKRKPSVRSVEKLSRALGIPNHLFTLLATESADLRIGDAQYLKQATQSLARLMLNNVFRKRFRHTRKSSTK